MKRSYAGHVYVSLVYASLAVAAGLGCQVTPANAAPPTVTPSPGYDSRLQQSRAPQGYDEPVVRAPTPVHRRHVKRVQDGTH